MKKVRLYAVRENEESNAPKGWRRRKQVVGSILLWAYRANATRVEFHPDWDRPFAYFDANGARVESELPQPPEDVRRRLSDRMFVDTIDGHPCTRPIKRLIRQVLNRVPNARLTVPDADHEVESQWTIRVCPKATILELDRTVSFVPVGKTE